MPWKSIEKRREYQRRYRAKNAKELHEKYRQYYLKTKAVHAAKSKAYYLAHKEEMTEYSKQWWKENRAAQLAMRREARNNFRKQVLQLIGDGHCAHCGCTDWRVLQLDHIHGDGYKNIIKTDKYKRGGSPQVVTQKQLDALKSDIKNVRKRLQVLCSNCNWIKRHERQETGWGKFRV